MTNTWSISGRISSSTAAGVAGLIATPTRLPSAAMLSTVRCRFRLPSQCTRNESEPASTNSSKKESGSVIIRCVSIGSCVTGRSEATIGAPIERFRTKCPSITSTCIRSAPARSASRTCSPRRAKSAARIEGAIFASRDSSRRDSSKASRGTDLLLEDVDELDITLGDVFYGVFPRDLVCAPVHERVPKARTAYCEADESRDSRSGRQPLVYLLVVFTPAQYDTADLATPAPARRTDDFFAIRPAIKALDLPDVRLNSCV